MKRNFTGFSLPEALLAVLILGLVATSVFYLISATNRSTLNAYYQYLGEQIAHEPLEVFRSIGYAKLSDYSGKSIADYQLNTWQEVAALSPVTGIERPPVSQAFERKITMQLLEKDGINAILLMVSVRPHKSGILGRSSEINCSAIIVEQP